MWAKQNSSSLVTTIYLRFPKPDCAAYAFKLAARLNCYKSLTNFEFDIYPRSGHVYYEPMLEREAMRNLEWFTRWIPAGPR